MVGSMIYRAYLKYFMDKLPLTPGESLGPQMAPVQKDRRILVSPKPMMAKTDLTEAEAKELGNPMIYGTDHLRDLGNYVSEEQGIDCVAEYVVKVIDNLTTISESSNKSRKRYNAMSKIMKKRGMNELLHRVCPEYMENLENAEKELMRKHNIDENEINGKKQGISQLSGS